MAYFPVMFELSEVLEPSRTPFEFAGVPEDAFLVARVSIRIVGVSARVTRSLLPERSGGEVPFLAELGAGSDG